MNVARGDGSEILLLGEHNADRGNKLEVGSEKSSRRFHITVHQGTYAFVLSSPDIISFLGGR